MRSFSGICNHGVLPQIQGGIAALIQKLLKAEEVAEFLDVPEKTVLRYAREGKLSSVGLDAKNIRFTKEQVDEFVESSTRNTEPKIFDTPQTRRLPYRRKEVKKSSGVSRAQFREEMRSW